MNAEEIRELERSPEMRAAIQRVWDVLHEPFTGKYLCRDANGVYCVDEEWFGVKFTGDCSHKKE